VGERIIDVQVRDLSAQAGPGDWGHFVGVDTGTATGWYGPVSAEVARYVKQNLTRCVVGLGVADHETITAALRACPTRDARESVPRSWAIGAVDCAAWDAHGVLSGQPVAQLLSATSVSDVSLYASWLSVDTGRPDMADVVRRVAEQEWRFTKWSLRRHDGRTPDDLVRQMAAVSTAADASCAFDALWTWNEAFLVEVERRLPDPSAVRWIEEPLATHGASSKLRGRLPLALGERLGIDDDATEILATDNLAVLALDVVGCGGLTNAVRLASAAADAGVPVMPHGRSFTPGLHLAAAFPHTVPAVEYQLQWEPRRQALYDRVLHPAYGAVHLDGVAGLGTHPRSV
jgi:L-alanine-DL-glutamate epimerase-like enolase superfamily enzyme